MDISQIKTAKNKRGRPYLNILRKWADPTKMDCLTGLYEKIAERKLKYKGGMLRYGKKDEIIDSIAKKYGVYADQLRVHVNRTKKPRTTRKSKK